MLLKFALVFIFTTLVLAGYFGVHYGAFKKIEISEVKVEPYYIAYRELEGVNSKAIKEIRTTLERDLAGLGITPLTPFDIYYPPESGELNKIGFEISQSGIEKLNGQGDVKSHIVESGEFITTTFPYKGSLSYLVMVMKVDPAFKAYRQKNGYGDIWAATRLEGDRIFCLQPIRRSDN